MAQLLQKSRDIGIVLNFKNYILGAVELGTQVKRKDSCVD